MWGGEREKEKRKWIVACEERVMGLGGELREEGASFCTTNCFTEFMLHYQIIMTDVYLV